MKYDTQLYDALKKPSVLYIDTEFQKGQNEQSRLLLLLQNIRPSLW